MFLRAIRLDDDRSVGDLKKWKSWKKKSGLKKLLEIMGGGARRLIEKSILNFHFDLNTSLSYTTCFSPHLWPLPAFAFPQFGDLVVVGSGQKIVRVGSIAGSGRQGGLRLMMPAWSVARKIRYQLQLGSQHWGIGLKNLSETCCNMIGRYIKPDTYSTISQQWQCANNGWKWQSVLFVPLFGNQKGGFVFHLVEPWVKGH